MARKMSDYYICYKPCEKCGHDTGRSGLPIDGIKRCWKCGNRIKRDYSERALKPGVTDSQNQ